MVFPDLSVIGNLEEVIESLSFRNEAHLRISKRKREIAYAQSVDILIETVDFNLYENSRASPPIQFYGYVNLVFQDCLSLEIPIHFPRQRIYERKQWEALRQWREVVQYWGNFTIFEKINDVNLKLLIDNLGEGFEPLETNLKENNWEELSLREIHVKCDTNCQFTIEYTQLQPVPYLDPVTLIITTGKSNQVDGDKDLGLPEAGIQPKKNTPEDPFLGNQPPSSESEINAAGLSLLDSGNLETEEPQKYFAQIIGLYTFPENSCIKRQGTYYYEVSALDTTFSEASAGADVVACGVTHQQTNLSLNSSGFLDFFIHSEPLSKRIIRGKTKPENEFINFP